MVDPGMTAIWEMRLDDVVLGKVRFRAVIDEICAEADKLIAVLLQHKGATVDLSQPAPSAGARRKTSPSARAMGGDPAISGDDGRRKRRKKPPAPVAAPQHKGALSVRAQPAANTKPLTEKMIAFAQRLAKEKDCKPPRGWDADFDICRSFLDRQLGR